MPILTTFWYITPLPSGPRIQSVTPGSVVVKVPTMVVHRCRPGNVGVVMGKPRIPSLASFSCHCDAGYTNVLFPWYVAYLCNDGKYVKKCTCGYRSLVVSFRSLIQMHIKKNKGRDLTQSCDKSPYTYVHMYLLS